MSDIFGSPPPPPNYTGAAQATAAGNAQAARVAQWGNMVNQNTPYGKVSYQTLAPTQYYDSKNQKNISADEYNLLSAKDKKLFTPIEQWEQNVTLSPEQQALFDQSVRVNQQLGNVAEGGVQYVKDAMGNPVKQRIDLQSSIPSTAGQMTTSVDNPELQTSIDSYVNDIQRKSGANERALESFDNNANQIQLDSGANQRANANTYQTLGQLQTRLQDPSLLAQDTTNALYKANTQYLDPQFQQAQAKLENQLANQGITRGSEAYNNAMLNFNNQKQQAYESARNQAIGGGIQAAQGMFGMNLQGGQFTNQALGQQFGQSVTQQQLANAAAEQNNQLALANQQAYNQALGQQYNQNLGAAQFANTGINQNNQLALANQQAYNQAIAQQYNQGLGAAQFGNQANQQMFNNALQNANLNNQVQNQLFGQNLSNAQLANQTSAQDIQQQLQLQQAPVNMLNAVRTGQQLQAANIPQVGVSQPGQLAMVGGPDLLSAATAQGQYNQGIYNAQSAAASQLAGAAIGAGGMLGGAGIAKFSDIRLKTNIIKHGIHKTLGIGLYTWDYIWGEKGAGVMAQELEKVMPEAVITMPDGFKAVNYSMLGA